MIEIGQIFSDERELKILHEVMARLDLSAEATVRYFCRMGQLVDHHIQQGYKLGWIKDGEVVDPFDMEPKMAPVVPPEPPARRRSCNRHSNCDKAEEEVMVRRGITRAEIHTSFHCHDDECEDCFGS